MRRHSSDRGAAAFICYLFFTIYNSLFKEKENRSRLEKKEKIFQQMYLFALFFTIYKLKGKKIEAGWKRRKWKAEKVGKDISKSD